MTDTIYTPNPLLAHVEARLAACSARYDALSAALVEAESEADWDSAQRLSTARDLCVSDISTLLAALNTLQPLEPHHAHDPRTRPSAPRNCAP